MLRGPGTFGGFFGNGLDGDVLVTGTLNLTRDMNYNNLILSGTAAGPPVIFTNSFIVNVRQSLIFFTSGTIDCSGGSGSVGGGAGTNPLGGMSPRFARTVLGSLASLGDGGLGALPASPGSTGSGGFSSFGGTGGSGGSPGVSVPGGPGGTITTPSGSSGSFKNPFFAMLGCSFAKNGPFFFAGGSGGGGGGSNTGTASGSGGGGGGGVVVIAARQIIVGVSGTYTEASSLTPGFPFSGSVSPFSGTVYRSTTNHTGTIMANGGAGASGLASVGAGGGGGGGVVFIITSSRPRLTGSFGSVPSSFAGLSSSLLIHPMLQSGTLSIAVNGGAGGVAGGGTAGSAGSAGQVFYLDV